MGVRKMRHKVVGGEKGFNLQLFIQRMKGDFCFCKNAGKIVQIKIFLVRDGKKWAKERNILSKNNLPVDLFCSVSVYKYICWVCIRDILIVTKL